METFQDLLFPTQFMPHGQCYLWQPELVWLHLLSDVMIAIAYYSIPAMLVYFVRNREDVPFPNIFLLFGLFITTCGTTHLMAVWTLWYPAYWLSGVLKAITAVVSIYTAFALFPTIPAALALPSPEKLRYMNQQLAIQITERKQAEMELQQLNQELEVRVEDRTAALKKSEQRFRSLFESAPDFIYVLDQQGIIQQVNSIVEQQSGYTESELLDHPLVAFLSADTQIDYPQEFATLIDQGNCQQEMEFICKDGRILVMEGACTVVEGSPADEDYILVLQRDITQRKQIEAERVELFATLQESERRWRSFLENIQLMVVSLEPSGQVEYVNPHTLSLMGYAESEVIGKNWAESFLPKYQQRPSQEILQQILHDENHSHYRYQGNVMTQSGQERMIAWNSTLLQDFQGQSTGILSIGEDITERHAIDRMKDEFISVVSHELRTPLTSIHGALDLLATGLVDPQSDRGQHVFSLAVENTHRLVQLVNDILELERLESGKIQLHQAAISTCELIQQAYELMALTVERENIQIEIAATDLQIWADSDRLLQVLTNLLSNAIKFSDPGSTVWIVAEATELPEGNYIKFAVKDQGRGIPSEEVEHIFERFHQVDASDSRGKGGTGLGLAICRSIVQQHGGHIWAQSVLGEGSCFYFTIPSYFHNS